MTGGRPECTNPVVDMPFLSPTLEKLDGPASLFEWWQRVSPSPDEVFGESASYEEEETQFDGEDVESQETNIGVNDEL